jgi:DNA polymerase III delta subunit-like protein
MDSLDCAAMPGREGPRETLARSLASERIHSAYLFTGPGEEPRAAAAWFARALACTGAPAARPCEACPACRRSTAREPVPLDGTGKSGPLYRHVGDHPDLLWVERGRDDTRVRIGQIRAVQQALHLRSVEGGRRAVVIADAEWLNLEAQNALLRTLEEPPPGTTFVLVTASPSGLAPTVRSRCQRVGFPAERAPAPDSPEAPESERELAARLAALPQMSALELLDWAEEFRGVRAVAASGVAELLGVASAWLHAGVRRDAALGPALRPRLDAARTLQELRQALAQRNANPQLVAERALLALREALPPREALG